MRPEWIDGALGGLLIGAGAMVLWLGFGRIAGISGILGGVLLPARGDVAWRLVFLIALIAGAGLWRAVAAADTSPVFAGPLGLYVVAGLLVGLGTRLGNGCTSGHGVCGLARLSPRSVAAVGVFMAAAMLTHAAARALGVAP